MTTEEALEILRSHKGWGRTPKGPEFLYATTRIPVDFGDDMRPAGTRVIVTMVSRFGDVGIRARNIHERCHGYDARVDPDDLTNWSEEPYDLLPI